MLTATILHLRAQHNGTITGGTGRAVHGFWYHHWHQTAPDMAQQLHDMPGSKPFTLSPLLNLPPARQGKTPIRAGTDAWVRVTTLNPVLSTALEEAWLPTLPPTIELAGITWQLTTIARTNAEHHWAGRTPFANLLAYGQDTTQPQRQWQLHFHTPTTFKTRGDVHMPLPIPDLLIGSWWRRWQWHTQHPLPDDSNLPWSQAVLLSKHTIKTVTQRYGRRLSIGFVGQATLKPHRLTPAGNALITMLAHFAFYAGTGQHTTQGMGMTRLRKEKSSRLFFSMSNDSLTTNIDQRQFTQRMARRG